MGGAGEIVCVRRRDLRAVGFGSAQHHTPDRGKDLPHFCTIERKVKVLFLILYAKANLAAYTYTKRGKA